MKKIFLLFLLLIISIIGFGQVKLYNFGYFIRIDYYTKIPEKIIDMPKRYMKVVRQGDYVYLGILDNYAEKILYSDVDIPLFVSSIAMEDTVLKWINESYDTISDNDSLYFKYCCNCDMITGWRLNGDTVFYDSCYVNKYILDSISNLKWNSLSGKIYQRDPTDTLWLKQYGTKYPDGTYQNTAFINTPDTTTWLAPVTSFTTPPALPDSADRYIASVTGGGWTVNYIYEWNTATWTPTIPVAGNGVVVLDSSAIFIYTGAAWVKQGATSNYWSLTGTVPNVKLFNNSGNYVGINKVNPAYALDVTGRINASTHLSTGAYIITPSSGFYKSALAKGSIGATTASGGANIWNFKSGTTGAGNTGGRYNFIIDNDTVGRFHRYNIFLGNLSGNQTMSGINNSFIGTASGTSNTTGSDNNFIGYGTGYSNTTGTQNNFIGSSTGWFNVGGIRNNFIGNAAGYNNNGSYNTYIGTSAGYLNTTGDYNIAIGNYAGYHSDTLKNRLFIGDMHNYYTTLHNDTTRIAIYGNENINRLTFNRKVTINDGTQGASKVFTSDANGNGSWQSNIKYISDTMYNKILAIRQNKPDTSFTQIDSLNSTKFPEGTYFEVFPGDYTVTDTIKVNKLNLFCHKGARLTKTLIGDMFNFSDTILYKKSVTIRGMGTFIHTTTSGCVLNTSSSNVGLASNLREVIFEFDTCLATISPAIYHHSANSDMIYKIKGNYLKPTGSVGIWLVSNNSANDIKVDINVPNIQSTANYGVYLQNCSGVLNSGVIQSTATDAIYLSSCDITSNVGYCDGLSYDKGYYITNVGGVGYSSVTINGASDGINNSNSASRTFLNGRTDFLTNYGFFNGGTVFRGITNVSGTLNTEMNSSGLNHSIGITGGDCNVLIRSAYNSASTITVSGGTLDLRGDYYCLAGGYILVNGTGKLIYNAHGRYNQYNTINNYSINVGAGTLIYKGSLTQIPIVNDSIQRPRLIELSGSGTVIFDDGVLYRQAGDTITQFIYNNSGSAQNIKIYSGGLNTNGNTNTNSVGELFSAKRQVSRIDVKYAIANTSITINGTPFTSAVSASTIAIATDMVSLINIGAVGVTATDNLNGTFYLESNVAGTAYTQTALYNVYNPRPIRNNAKGLTDVVGGGLIQDSDIINY